MPGVRNRCAGDHSKRVTEGRQDENAWTRVGDQLVRVRPHRFPNSKCPNRHFRSVTLQQSYNHVAPHGAIRVPFRNTSGRNATSNVATGSSRKRRTSQDLRKWPLLGSGPSELYARGGSSPLFGTFLPKDLRQILVSPPAPIIRRRCLISASSGIRVAPCGKRVGRS